MHHLTSQVLFALCPYISLAVSFGPVVENYKVLGRTIIYCQKQEKCANLYLCSKICMRNEILEPLSRLDVSRCCLMDMFISSTL